MTRNELMAWMIVGTSFLVGSFMRSTTIGSNDLGWRCFLQAQLVLLLWGAVLVDEWSSSGRVARPGRLEWADSMRVLAAIGLLGTMYQVVMLRVYPILQDHELVDPTTATWLDPDLQLGKRTYALRSVYGSLANVLTPGAIVQYNPDAISFIPHQLYSGHGAAMGLPLCGTVFGGDLLHCEDRAKFVVHLFEKPSQADSDSLDAMCREFGIDALLVDDLDYAWRKHDSWVWTRKPILANGHARAFACGDSSEFARFARAQ